MAILCEIPLGPAATILASIVAAGVTIYFAGHQKRIAEEQKRIAEEQKDITKHKLRYDLYQRRFEIFNSIYPFSFANIQEAGVRDLPPNLFLYKTSHYFDIRNTLASNYPRQIR